MLTDLFGKSPHARILDFLLERAGFDHSISELSRGSGVARPTVYKVVEELLRQGVLVETRTIGNSRFFALNQDNDRVRRLLSAFEPIGGGLSRGGETGTSVGRARSGRQGRGGAR